MNCRHTSTRAGDKFILSEKTNREKINCFVYYKNAEKKKTNKEDYERCKK